jgi:hypothetical protein
VTRPLFLSTQGAIGNMCSESPGVARWDQYLKRASVTVGVLARIVPTSIALGVQRLATWPRVALDVAHQVLWG